MDYLQITLGILGFLGFIATCVGLGYIITINTRTKKSKNIDLLRKHNKTTFLER